MVQNFITLDKKGESFESPAGRCAILTLVANSKWQKLSSKYVLENPWYKVRQDKVIRPDGKEGTYNVVECSKSVFVVPITADGKVILVRLFRYTTHHEGWEVPAGGIEKGESPIIAAQRELQEETGCTSNSWKEIGIFDLMNGMTDAVAYVFEAKELTATIDNKQVEEGIIKTGAFTLEQILSMVQDGQIVDALSIAALMQMLSAHNLVKGKL